MQRLLSRAQRVLAARIAAHPLPTAAVRACAIGTGHSARQLSAGTTAATATPDVTGSAAQRRLRSVVQQLLTATTGASAGEAALVGAGKSPSASTASASSASSASAELRAIDALFAAYSAATATAPGSGSADSATDSSAWVARTHALQALASELAGADDSKQQPARPLWRALQTRLSQVHSPAGLFALLDLRKDLLDVLAHVKAGRALATATPTAKAVIAALAPDAERGARQLVAFDNRLQHLLSVWFSPRAVTRLSTIDWVQPSQRPAAAGATQPAMTRTDAWALVQHMAAHEAVHPVRSTDALQQRLAPARGRCVYALLHPQLPGFPLAFVSVALTDGMSGVVQRLLSADTLTANSAGASASAQPLRPKCAIFYSICSCHNGLQGVGVGHALIVRAAAALHAQYGDLHTFATLSPMPGFGKWLSAAIDSGVRRLRFRGTAAGAAASAPAAPLLTDAECQALLSLDAAAPAAEAAPATAEDAATTLQQRGLTRLRVALDALMQTRVDTTGAGPHTPATDPLLRVLQPVLTRLAARYLLVERRPLPTAGRASSSASSEPQKFGPVIDPVQNFHIGNGAFVGRINFYADRSARGLRASYGMMVNYVYGCPSPASSAVASAAASPAVQRQTVDEMLSAQHARGTRYAECGVVSADARVVSCLAAQAPGVQPLHGMQLLDDA